MNGELSGGTNGMVYERSDEAGTPRMNLKNKEPMVFASADIALSFAMLVCGFLYWNLIRIDSLGLGVTLFTVLLCAASMIYFKQAGLRQTKESLAFLVIIALSAANFALFDGLLIKFFNFIFLSLCYVYWICLTAGARLENRISPYIVSDMLRQLILVPFSNFSGCFSGVKQVFVRNQKGKGLLGAILGILFFLPVLILVVTLLASADAAFESLMDKLQLSISENVVLYIRDIILGLPVACYLFGLIYGNRYQRGAGNNTKVSVDRRVEALRFAPGVTVFSAMTALNLIYLIFFLSQTAYLFSAFGDSLPQSMTYAEYARRGFFELCALSGINLAVIGGAQLIAKRDKIKVLRGETAVLCVFTIALIVTAMSKMVMYIDSYGLTKLRVYTSWFMVILLFLFVIILIRQFRSFQGTRLAVVGCICLFLVLCCGNADGLIAKYNIERYQAGTLKELDVSSLSDLSGGAVPYLYELYQDTDDPELKKELRNAIKLSAYRGMRYEDGLRGFNLQHYKAEQIRNNIQ